MSNKKIEKAIKKVASFFDDDEEKTIKEEKANKKTKSEPKKESIRKCPNCGAILKAFDSICPYCNAEITNKEATSSMKEFQEGLKEIMARELPKYQAKQSLLKKIIGSDLKSDNERIEFEERVKEEREEEIANYIKNYPVPNAYEDLVEFMILSTTNIKVKEDIDGIIPNAWQDKMDQIIAKAKITLKDSSELQTIEELYNKKKLEIKKQKRKGIIIGLSIFLLLIIIPCLIMSPFITLSIITILISIIIFIYTLIKNQLNIGKLTIKRKSSNIICLIILIIGIILGIKGLFFNKPKPNPNYENYYNEKVKKYNVNIDIDFEENIIFNKYDVDVTLYDEKDTLYHGVDKTLTYQLPIGTHKIEFSGDGNHKTIELKIKGDTYIKYKLSCHTDEIRIKELEYTTIEEKQEEQEEQEQQEQQEEQDQQQEEQEVVEEIPVKETIKLPNELSYYIGKDANSIKEELESLGFTNIVINYEKTNNSTIEDNTIITITINNQELNNIDEYEKESNIIITSWQYEKPVKKDIPLPPSGSKLSLDLDSKSESTACYLNVDGIINIPKIQKWKTATVTDSIAEYLNYLVKLGYTVTITNSTNKSPYSGYKTYETNFKVSGKDITWTMYSFIESEKYVEYEFDISLQ